MSIELNNCDNWAFASRDWLLAPWIGVHVVSTFTSFILLFGLMFKSVLLDAFLVYLSFSVRSLLDKIFDYTVDPFPDDPVINFTAISNLDVTTLSITVKIASWTQFLTAVRTLLNSSLTPLAIFLSKICLWRVLFSPNGALPESSTTSTFSCITTPSSITYVLVSSSLTKSFKVSAVG